MKDSRKYQLAIENDIPRHLKEYGSTIVQAPTGSGKSHIINKTVKRIVSGGLTPLVISDSIKIHRQLVHECNAGRIDSGAGRHWFQLVGGHPYVAMAQTLSRRNNIIEEFKKVNSKTVVIIDECHRNTMTSLVHDIEPRFLLGFSATPHYKWAKHLPKLYKSIICGPQINVLVEDGHLCHYQHIVRSGAKLDELEVNKAGEYTDESQERVFGSKKMYDGIFEDLPAFSGGGKTVVYVSSISQCEKTYEELKAKGYRVCRYHSALKDATYELAKFTHTHEADICVSVSALTMGWDYPPITTVVLWRSTNSLPLYLQMIGRGGRPLSVEDAITKFGLRNYHKTQFTVLDYGGNYERFGGWNMDRDWSELWQDPKTKRKISTYAGVAGSKMCPTCQALLPMTARSCYNCGYMYPAAEIELIDGRLLEVANTMNAMKNRRISDLGPEELANYAKFHDKKNFAIRAAKAQEQQQPGFLKAFAAAMNYRTSWVQRIMESMPEEPIDYRNILIK